MKLLIVESPSKAKTIGKYLGGDFIVLSSAGHIRSIPSKQNMVDCANNFTPQYEILEKGHKFVDEIVKNAKKANEIYLATDPDREGEAIAWHIARILMEKSIIKSVSDVHRIVFYEITKKAIQAAIENKGEIRTHLVSAQRTREILDYLMGFTLSPILWRKLPGTKSAGRVQSVALRKLCEVERDIILFQKDEYWSIDGIMKIGTEDIKIKARLVELDGTKIEKLSIKKEEEALAIEEVLHKFSFLISNVEEKEVSYSPPPPFTTSTLLQEASKKFGFSAKKTSQIAQKLYEGVMIGSESIGLITYMRTDSVSVSQDILAVVNNVIRDKYGEEYSLKKNRTFVNKIRNAQEAHEAIRPTDPLMNPEKIKAHLELDFYKIYTLIWTRLIASQMQVSKTKQLTICITGEGAGDRNGKFRATTSCILFDGFNRVYNLCEVKELTKKTAKKKTKDMERDKANDEEDSDDDDLEIELGFDIIAPHLKNGALATLLSVLKNQHFTKPPSRYTEASLVKAMEEMGIGRPSTYPSIIDVLQKREYAVIREKKFFPEARGIILSAFLENTFDKYIAYDFTAQLENELDEVANGAIKYLDVLEGFWGDFNKQSNDIMETEREKIVDVVKQKVDFLFKKYFGIEDVMPICSTCNKGNMILKFGRLGAFLGCSSYPDCTNLMSINTIVNSLQGVDGSDFNESNENGGEEGISSNGRSGAQYPIIITDTDEKQIKLCFGRFGFYLECEYKGSSAEKRRSSVPAHFIKKINGIQSIEEKDASNLLVFPKVLGINPETKEEVTLGINKYGGYILHKKKYTNLKTFDIFDITLEDALKLI